MRLGEEPLWLLSTDDEAGPVLWSGNGDGT